MEFNGDSFIRETLGNSFSGIIASYSNIDILLSKERMYRDELLDHFMSRNNLSFAEAMTQIISGRATMNLDSFLPYLARIDALNQIKRTISSYRHEEGRYWRREYFGGL